MNFKVPLFFTFICWFAFSSLFARIEECDSVQDLLKFADSNTLIVFDIDNIIFTTAQTLGCDQWLIHQIEENKRQGLPHDLAKKNAVDLWCAIQCHTDVLPMESCTASIIQQLQDKESAVMALTTRSEMIADRTIDQLASLKIDMSRQAPSKIEFRLKEIPDILWKRGILFMGDTDKGKAFMSFLNELNLNPTRILFINDKKKTIEELEGALPTSETEFLGFRYTYADKYINSFNSEIAKLQLEDFHEFLSSSLISNEETFSFISDEEATKALKPSYLSNLSENCGNLGFK